MAEKALLTVKHLTKKFGGLTAVNNCSFEVKKNEILGMIGPNGSGKTTIVNLITNFLKCDAGDIYFKNERINHLKSHQIIRMGIGRTFQICRIFGNLTVFENMVITEAEEKKVHELLEFVGLTRLKNEYAKNISYGQQKLLELAQVLTLDPELVLLDEPVGGIHPEMVKKIFAWIQELNDQGKTFLIIEHNIKFVTKICQRIIALVQGKIIADDVPEKVQQNKRVLQAYLGG